MWEVVYPTSRAVELDAEDDEEEKCMVQSNFTTPIVRLSHELQSDGKTVSCKLLVLAFERISTTFIEAHFLNNESQIVGLVSSGNIKEGCTVTNSLRQTASSDKTCFMHSADGSHEVLFCQCKIDVPPEACHNWANEVCIDAILRAIPFNVHTPLWTSSIKFEPLRRKDQSGDANTPPEIKKFLPYPSEKTQRSKDADAHNPSETAFSTPLRNSRP